MYTIEELKEIIKKITKNNKMNRMFTIFSYYKKHNLEEFYEECLIEHKRRGFTNELLSQVFYNILNDIMEPPKCIICLNEDVDFINFTSGYKKCKSKLCRKEHKKLYVKETFDKKQNLIKHYIPNYNVLYNKEEILSFINIEDSNLLSTLLYNNKSYIVDQIYSRTSYLNITCNFYERLYHIFNDIYENQICPFCNKNNKKFINFLKGYRKICNSEECIYKQIAIINIGRIQKEETKIKRYNTRKNNGQIWCTEETKHKISIKNIITWKENPENHLLGVEKKKQNGFYKEHGENLKQKILNGEWTPHISNSWANSRCKLQIDGYEKGYRSSWDATFQILNPTCQYEKIRIKYFSKIYEKYRNYITDFVDEENKIIYEIKPDGLLEDQTNIDKKEAAIIWCKENCYQYLIIGNSYFIENAKNVDFSLYDEKIYKGMKQFLKDGVCQ